MKIIKNTSYSNTTSSTNRPIKYIVIHYTAGSTSRTGSAVNTANMFSNPSVGASADFIVDDATAVQFNPDIKNRYCWHCGDSRNNTKGGSYYGKCTNANSIGIEVCCTNDKYSNKTPANHKDWYFTDAVVNKAVELTKYLMQTYNISAANVIRHYDVSGKLCPGIVGWNAESGSEAKWQAFKAKLAGAGTATTHTSDTNTATQISKPQTSNTATSKSFLVKVSISDLRIRKTPSLSGAFVKFCPPSVYTIVETKTADGYTWGKLKSGAGWIALDYTTKI